MKTEAIIMIMLAGFWIVFICFGLFFPNIAMTSIGLYCLVCTIIIGISIIKPFEETTKKHWNKDKK